MRGESQAITLDVGGTLIEPWPSVGHVYSQAAADHGCPNLSPALLNHQFARAWSQLADFRHTRRQWRELVDATFAGVAPEPLDDTFFTDLYDRFAEPGAWRIYDDVRPALERLAARGTRMAVLSNWDERLRPLLRKLELDHFFESLIVSHEVGSAKPAKEIFDYALRNLALPPGRVLHVGDSRSMDYLGAQSAGLRALLLDRRAKQSTRTHIRSLIELLP
jgi:putative hydrolase of the HAD superfamily